MPDTDQDMRDGREQIPPDDGVNPVVGKNICGTDFLSIEARFLLYIYTKVMIWQHRKSHQTVLEPLIKHGI